MKAVASPVALAGAATAEDSDSADPNAARLLIRGPNGAGLSAQRRMLDRLARWLIGRRGNRPELPLKLTVQDLEGHRVGVFEAAGRLTALRLPPGTYVVMASNGSERRTYTLTLIAGASFELHVDLVPASHSLPATPE